MISIDQIVNQSKARAKRWHGQDEWSALEWAGAMCGEAGEAANAAKKLRHMESGRKTINEPGRQFEDIAAAKKFIAKEVADTILYAVLLAIKVDADLEKVLVEVFNKKSYEYGFPERLIIL